MNMFMFSEQEVDTDEEIGCKIILKLLYLYTDINTIFLKIMVARKSAKK
jgi:hypothetical protein